MQEDGENDTLGALVTGLQRLESDIVWLYANLDQLNREVLVEAIADAAAGLGSEE